MEAVNLFLSKTQLHKLANKKPFQLSHKQLKATHGRHHVALHLHKTHHQKLIRNVRSQKGFRFMPDMIQGGTLLDDVKSVTPSIVAASKMSGVDELAETIKNAILSHLSERASKGGDLLDDIIGKMKEGAEKLGEPFNSTVGVNPVTLGYDLGKNVIGPAIIPDDFSFKKAFGGRIRKNSIPVEGGAIIGGIPQTYNKSNSNAYQPMQRGGSFVSPGGGTGLVVHGKKFSSIKEKMDYLRSLRRKK